jgi:hypothetical protein
MRWIVVWTNISYDTLSQDRIRNINDIPNLCTYFFVEPDWKSEEAAVLLKKLNKQALSKFRELYRFTRELASDS